MNRSNLEVIESFIKASMCGNFDARGFGVTPKDVLGGVLHASKEDAGARVGDEFCCSFSWWSNPCMTPKGPKVREVFNDVGCFGDWRCRGVLASGDRIV